MLSSKRCQEGDDLLAHVDEYRADPLRLGGDGCPGGELRLLLIVHELAYQDGDLIGGGIEREVSSLDDVDLRVWHVFAIAFRLPVVE